MADFARRPRKSRSYSAFCGALSRQSLAAEISLRILWEWAAFLPPWKVRKWVMRLIDGVGDYVRIGFKQPQAQKPIVVGWLLLGRNSQPLVIRVKIVRHGRFGQSRQNTRCAKAAFAIIFNRRGKRKHDNGAESPTRGMHYTLKDCPPIMVSKNAPPSGDSPWPRCTGFTAPLASLKSVWDIFGTHPGSSRDTSKETRHDGDLAGHRLARRKMRASQAR